MTLRVTPDINECLRFGTCSQLCNNTKGGHLCSCARNFMKTHNTCKAEGAEPEGEGQGAGAGAGAGGAGRARTYMGWAWERCFPPYTPAQGGAPELQVPFCALCWEPPRARCGPAPRGGLGEGSTRPSHTCPHPPLPGRQTHIAALAVTRASPACSLPAFLFAALLRYK